MRPLQCAPPPLKCLVPGEEGLCSDRTAAFLCSRSTSHELMVGASGRKESRNRVIVTSAICSCAPLKFLVLGEERPLFCPNGQVSFLTLALRALMGASGRETAERGLSRCDLCDLLVRTSQVPGPW